MTTGTITGTVTQTVILGSKDYPRTLDIAATGDIAPAAGGSAGIFLPRRIQNATITNQGHINGAAGNASGGNGGIAVDLLAAASVTNSGTITGGAATYNYNDPTTTTIHGGTGVDLSAGGSLSNTGLIRGGYGGALSYADPSGAGGAGVVLNDATLANEGTIQGGDAAQSGPKGQGGAGGVGAELVNASIGTNSGAITGGTGAYEGGAGGTGVLLVHSALTNTGTITGGYGGNSYYGFPGTGGVGVALTHGAILNDAGQITGGHGGYGHFGGYTGGVGVTVDASLMTISGTVTGGIGGDGSESYGGNGGVGVVLNSGLVELTATGTITGGTVGESAMGQPMAYGGVGVQINGGTFIDNGSIAGGYLTRPTHPGDAIAFGKAAGTLAVGTHAVLDGNVAAHAGDGDTLVLAAGGAGTLAGLGKTITGFDAITVADRADWTLSGTTTLTATQTLRDNATLTLGGAIAGAGAITLDAGSTLTASAGVRVASLGFNGAATLVLDKVASVTSTLSGFSTGDTIDLAKLKVTSADYLAGTLTLENGTTAVGTLAFSGSFSQDNFHVASDGHTGTDITFVASAPADRSPAALDLFEPGRGLWESFLHGILR